MKKRPDRIQGHTLSVTHDDAQSHKTGLSRRDFIGRAAAAGAALLGTPWSLFSGEAGGWQTRTDEESPWFEASIPQLQSLMTSGQMSCTELTAAYLSRIERLNPLLNAVIETNPDALATAKKLDAERRSRRVRGPLHGIPILVKDNIAVEGRMETTAGSLALVGSKVPGDAPLVAQLRAAGAVILGKANLSEWANFRGWAWSDGWSARGGFTQNPYDLRWSPGGSSSGSAVAAATNLCAIAIGTETDGSILYPAGNNLIVGLKPSLGLISQQGIIPISRNQDTAGPMGRTVADVAIMLGALQNPAVASSRKSFPRDYTAFLRRGSLRGARIGVDRRHFYSGSPFAAVTETAIEAMRSLGAIIIDPVDSGDPNLFWDAEYYALLCEFKVHIAQYLATLSRTPMRSLADIMAFNEAQCPQELRYFGQEVFESAQATSGDLTDPDYVAARQLSSELTRAQGIDAAIRRHGLDVIVAPTYSGGSSSAAVAGYPSLSLPVGFTPDGRGVGLAMYSGYMQEATLLALAYDLEQELQSRLQPNFAGDPTVWPETGICGAASATKGATVGLSWKAHAQRKAW